MSDILHVHPYSFPSTGHELSHSLHFHPGLRVLTTSHPHLRMSAPPGPTHTPGWSRAGVRLCQAELWRSRQGSQAQWRTWTPRPVQTSWAPLRSSRGG